MQTMISNKNIIITGKPGCGKSTLISRLKEYLNTDFTIKIGGISTPEIRRDGVRVGFNIINIYSNEIGILSHINQKSGPRISKYKVNLKDLNEIGVKAIVFAIKNCDIIFLDEIGKMEIISKNFQNAVLDAFNSSKIVIATMGLRIRHTFIDEIKSRNDIEILHLTINNRENIFKQIKQFLLLKFKNKLKN